MNTFFPRIFRCCRHSFFLSFFLFSFFCSFFIYIFLSFFLFLFSFFLFFFFFSFFLATFIFFFFYFLSFFSSFLSLILSFLIFVILSSFLDVVWKQMHLSLVLKKRHISYLPSPNNKQHKYINHHFMHFKRCFDFQSSLTKTNIKTLKKQNQTVRVLKILLYLRGVIQKFHFLGVLNKFETKNVLILNYFWLKNPTTSGGTG